MLLRFDDWEGKIEEVEQGDGGAFWEESQVQWPKISWNKIEESNLQTLFD